MSGHTRQDRHLDPGAAGSPVHLLPGLGATPGTVTVAIGPRDAATRRGQLLVWATVNLLLRCYGVLDSVTVHCPDVVLAAGLPHLLAGAPTGHVAPGAGELGHRNRGPAGARARSPH
jgi:hypothetical protein